MGAFMAFSKYRSFGLLAAAIGCIIASSATATASTIDDGAYASNHYGGTPHYVLVTNVPDHMPAWVIPSVAIEAAVPRSVPIFRPYAQRERASLNAVRPTAVAGWRSGRVSRLARC
jgi:hypothetical protein